MISIARHTIAFGRIFILAFLFASSGFTAIVHICTMETCECCDTSGTCAHEARSDKQVPAPAAGMFIPNAGDCCINAVAGGLAVVEALVEKDIEAQNADVLSLLTPTFVSPAPGNISSWFSCSCLKSVSQPSVEKCVLNKTFLI